MKKNILRPTLVLLIATLLLSFLDASASARRRVEIPLPPKNYPRAETEFRGVWIAFVHNIDWPKKRGTSASAQRTEMIRLFDLLQSLNINAVILQVRAACDVIYPSRLEPWTPFLSGVMDENPGWDPLAFAIRQAHSRGMELHAWINPFRALASDRFPPSRRHVLRQNPNLSVKYEGKTWLNPALQESKRRAIAIVSEIIGKYNIDGIHIDDYFYPYPKNVKSWHADKFPDRREYESYRRKGGKLNRIAWRQMHINSFVRSLQNFVKSAKPSLRFGISPFGIWQSGVPRGTKATLDPLKHLGADSRLWLRKSYCDYFSPQLYWRIRPQDQSYALLLRWWLGQSPRNVRLWPGIAASRIMSNDDPGRPAREILDQIAMARQMGAGGHILFSASALMENRDGISNKLRQTLYRNKAALPPR